MNTLSLSQNLVNELLESTGIQTSTKKILVESNLDYTVSKVPLQTVDGQMTDYIVTRRDDTNVLFGTFKQNYEIFQNSELVELLGVLSNLTELELTKGGAIHDGRKVILQLKSKSYKLNGDVIDNYITAINSFDGTCSLSFGNTNITLSCTNQFSRFRRLAKNPTANGLTNIRHTSKMRDKINHLVSEINQFKKQEQELMKSFEIFGGIKATESHVKQLTKHLLKIDSSLSMAQLQKELSTRAFNIYDNLNNSIASEMKQKGNTMWGLLSGVTHFTTHVNSVPQRENGRLESCTLGSNLKLNETAFNIISQL